MPEPIRKYFHVGDVLSITTGRLLSPSGMSGVYDILNFVLDENLYTHQLPRAAECSKEFLLQQCPVLRNIEVPEYSAAINYDRWVQIQHSKYGQFNIRAMTPEELKANYVSKGPISELLDMKGKYNKEADLKLKAEVFDLETDLIETLQATTPIKVDPKADAPLVTAIAKWARSRGAVAP